MGEDIVAIILSHFEEHGFDLREDNLVDCIRFLERQYEKHKEDYEWDLETPIKENKYLSLMYDKLILFAYLARLNMITASNGELISVDTPEMLKLLRIKAKKSEWASEELYELYRRRFGAYNNQEMPSYSEIINEIGEDEQIVKIWGKKIFYETDICSESASAKRRGRERRKEFSGHSAKQTEYSARNNPIEDKLKQPEYAPLTPHLDFAARVIVWYVEHTKEIKIETKEVAAKLLERMVQLAPETLDRDKAEGLIKIDGSSSVYDEARRGWMISRLLQAANAEYKNYGITLVVENGKYKIADD